jgi:hypothetical protein
VRTLSGYLVKNWYSSNRLWTMQEKTCCSLSLPLSRKLASMSTTAGIASWPPYIFCKQDECKVTPGLAGCPTHGTRSLGEGCRAR